MSRASDFEGLEKECATAYTERVKDIRRIARETKTFVGDSKKEREAMASALHRKIDTEEAARKRQAKADSDSRVAADKKLKADTRKMVNEMDADTKAMASALHKKIDADEAARKRQAKADSDSRVAADKKLKADARKLVNQMDADTKDMAAALHKKIDADEAARKRQAKADSDSRVAADKKLKADARKLVAGFKAETDAAGKAWGSLVKTMAEKRKGIAKKPAAPPKKKLPAKKAAKKKAPVVPAGDVAKVTSLVRANPKGIKLTEIESKTGLARIQAARILRGLIDGGKITKEELLYKPL